MEPFSRPQRTGVQTAAEIPSSWTGDDYQWVIDLPGKGSSSPAIWNDRLFITACDEASQKRSLICLDSRTGKQLWTQPTKFKQYKKHKNNSFASSTPCCDSDHVYVAWHSKERSPLIAYDHRGNKVWEYDLGPFSHGQGGATSPIVYNDLVIIAHDQKQPSFLLAVNRRRAKKSGRSNEKACEPATQLVRLPTRRSIRSNRLLALLRRHRRNRPHRRKATLAHRCVWASFPASPGVCRSGR